MLTEVTVLNGYAILSDKAVRLSYRTDIKRGDVLIASNLVEELLVPGQDVSSREQEIQDICTIIWTPEVIAAYRTERLPT